MAEKKSFLVEALPLSKGAANSSLSYFSSVRLPKGTLVRVPVRKSLVLAVIVGCRDVQTAKTEIRRAGFLLKKISKKDILEALISLEFMSASIKTAEHYATSIGSVLATTIPKAVLDNLETHLSPTTIKKTNAVSIAPKETMLLQMEIEERFGQYRAIVRQNFAAGKSIIFMVPTNYDIKFAQRELSHGIENFVHLQKDWGKAIANPHPVLFITTPSGVAFRRRDLGTIIIERENSRAYRTLARPFINFKYFVEQYAKLARLDLVLGDSVFSLETLWKEKEGVYGENSLIRWRLPGAPTQLIDAKIGQNEHQRFEIFSAELKDLLHKAVDTKERIFLFGARKGLSPTTVCGDCGTVLECENCKAPMVLHTRGDLRVYICHACGQRRQSETYCSYCKSWKLVPLGIGIQEIARSAREMFPHTPVHILDKDHASTDAKVRGVMRKFSESGGILVGTELAFFHLESVPYSALVSVDSLFSIPDFGINERIFYLVSRLREITQKESIIQTRNIGRQILAWAGNGNIIDFYSSEIEERESLLYPPFSLFIKITVPKKDIHIALPRLKESFAKWQPDAVRDSLVIRIERGGWPDQELRERLALLPIEFSIKVDPESIL